MLLIPLRTDAADRIPWATVGLIAANIAVALLFGFPRSGDAFVNSLVLRFGHFNPLTWITSSFVHYGFIHLLGNLVFLWIFGLITEPLAGWRRFLALYFAIAVACSAVVQVLMLGAQGQAAGASDAIFGLVAAGALWAPRNKVKMLLWVLYFVWTFDISVLGLVSVYVGLQLLWVMASGFAMSGALIHVLGAGTGLALAWWMLKQGWVDTGGLDLLHTQPAAPPPLPPVDPRAEALVRIRDALDAGQAAQAEDAYSATRVRFPNWHLPRADLERLAEALHAAGFADQAVARRAELGQDAAELRLQLARELLDAQRPRQALEQLRLAEEAGLSPALRARCEQLRYLARDVGGSGLELE